MDEQYQASTTGPLAGVRVVDFSQFMAAPLATTVFAEQGADVIKVEPLHGDAFRNSTSLTSRRGVPAMFINANRSKRSIALDLKSPSGLRIAKRLVKTADIVVENFRPGVAERLGIGYEAVRETNPRVVYASSTGWGSVGPFANRKAYDPAIQAYSGIAYVQGEGRDTGPEPVRSLMGDKIAPILLANAILAALFEAQRSGVGQRIETTMLHSLLWWLWPDMLQRETFVNDDGVTVGIMPSEQRWVYATADGYVALNFVNPAEWKSFAVAVGHPEFGDHTEVPEDLVAAVLFTRTSDEWLELLDSLGIAVAPVREPAELLDDAQIRALGAVTEVRDSFGEPLRLPSHFATYSKTPARSGAAPRLGQHTPEVLREAGFTDEEIDQFGSEGAVAWIDSLVG